MFARTDWRPRRKSSPANIITDVNRAPVHTAEEFDAAMAKSDVKKGVLLFLKREGTATFEILKDR
jgi:hypothetical protein